MDDEEVVKDDSIVADNVQLISPEAEDAPNVSPEIPDDEEQKQEEDPANIDDESPEKHLVN